MIKRNIFSIESEIELLRQKILNPGFDKKEIRRLKGKIQRRQKILDSLYEQLERDIMHMNQYKILSEKPQK